MLHSLSISCQEHLSEPNPSPKLTERTLIGDASLNTSSCCLDRAKRTLPCCVKTMLACNFPELLKSGTDDRIRCAKTLQTKSSRLETCLCISFAHTLAPTASALNGAQYAVHVCCSAPLLMGQDVHAKLLLASLNQLYISQHAIDFEVS